MLEYVTIAVLEAGWEGTDPSQIDTVLGLITKPSPVERQVNKIGAYLLL